MREAIGGTWLFQIVIVFILLFTGFMCLTINRSKAFNVKDQIIQTIQNYNGVNVQDGYDEYNTNAFSEIVGYIKENSFRTTGKTPKDEMVNGENVSYECYDRNGKILPKNSDLAVFCIAPIDISTEACSGPDCFNELPKMTYYREVVFYQLDLPVFAELFNFKVVGDTKTLYGDPL